MDSPEFRPVYERTPKECRECGGVTFEFLGRLHMLTGYGSRVGVTVGCNKCRTIWMGSQFVARLALDEPLEWRLHPNQQNSG